ncbi:MAG: hypothetical protein PVG96_04940 [Desulfobacterales bacterium]|jgi:chromosome segregation ATPase
MKAKSKLSAGALLVLLLFVGGVLAGYYVWGLKDDETVDYKRLLKDTVKYIASLEQKNSELEKQIGAGDTSLRSTEDEKPSEEVKPAGEDANLQQKIKSLEEEKAALQVAMSSDKDLTAENQSLTEQIRTLTAEKADLEQKITELQSDTSQDQNFVEARQQLENQIQACLESKADLEKENTELQSLKSNNEVLTAENQTLQDTLESHVNEINVLKTRLTEIRSMTQVQKEAEAQSTDTQPEATQ